MLWLADYVRPCSWGRLDNIVVKPIFDGFPKSFWGAGDGRSGAEVENKVTKKINIQGSLICVYNTDILWTIAVTVIYVPVVRKQTDICVAPYNRNEYNTTYSSVLTLRFHHAWFCFEKVSQNDLISYRVLIFLFCLFVCLFVCLLTVFPDNYRFWF